MRSNAAPKAAYYILTTCIAITFLAPLVWAVISSVSPAPGTSQTSGFGLGNYVALFEYGRGLPAYLLNSLIISVVVIPSPPRRQRP